MWKDLTRPFIRPLPQWSAVAVASPQRVVTATLHWDGKSTDVTQDHTVASLKPLVIATGIDAGKCPVLEYSDNATGRRLGVLRLAHAVRITAAGTPIFLYLVAASEHFCLPWPRRPWNAWLQNCAMLKMRTSRNRVMEPAAVQQLMIAYLCPRPVVLVSVAAPGHQNIFPTDLIGPLERSGLFSLALRTTDISAQVMQKVRRIALSSVPATMRSVIDRLGEQHQHPLSDWNALPFPVRPSREFGIPVAAAALRVRELAIEESLEIGSHILFLARVVADTNLAGGVQLHRTPGFHQAYRRRLDMPLAEA